MNQLRSRRPIVQDLMVLAAGAQVLADPARGEIPEQERLAVVLRPLSGVRVWKLPIKAGVAAVEDEELVAARGSSSVSSPRCRRWR